MLYKDFGRLLQFQESLLKRKFEAAVQRCSAENLFWKFQENSQENILRGVLFDTKIELHLVCFPANFQKNFWNSFFTEHPQTAASDNVGSTKDQKNEWLAQRRLIKRIISEAFSEPSRTSKMEFIEKITIFTLCYILYFELGSEYAFVFDTLESKHLVILSRGDRNLKSTLIVLSNTLFAIRNFVQSIKYLRKKTLFIFCFCFAKNDC